MSTLKVDNLQTSSGAPQYTAKAWVNFNGTGTVAIRASGNVSSITDNGAGKYIVNFTTAMPDANYSVSGSAQSTGVAAVMIEGALADPSQLTTTSSPISCVNANGTNADSSTVSAAIFR